MCFWVTIILLTNRSKEVAMEIKFNKMKINLYNRNLSCYNGIRS